MKQIIYALALILGSPLFSSNTSAKLDGHRIKKLDGHRIKKVFHISKERKAEIKENFLKVAKKMFHAATSGDVIKVIDEGMKGAKEGIEKASAEHNISTEVKNTLIAQIDSVQTKAIDLAKSENIDESKAVMQNGIENLVEKLGISLGSGSQKVIDIKNTQNIQNMTAPAVTAPAA